MRVWNLAVALLTVAAGAQATEIQGVLADWTCVKTMVQDGREKTLQRDKACSLDQNYSRQSYGVITADKHFFQLDDAGRGWALKLLKDSPNKDNLYVVIQGEIEGDVVHVRTMSEL